MEWSGVVSQGMILAAAVIGLLASPVAEWWRQKLARKDSIADRRFEFQWSVLMQLQAAILTLGEAAVTLSLEQDLVFDKIVDASESNIEDASKSYVKERIATEILVAQVFDDELRSAANRFVSSCLGLIKPIKTAEELFEATRVSVDAQYRALALCSENLRILYESRK